MTSRQYIIPTGPRLGRGMVNHDERSKLYKATAFLTSNAEPRTKTWRSHRAYDQGQTPYCVAETSKGILNTAPMSGLVPYDVRSRYKVVDIYTGAQKYDQWPGEAYEGTSALGAMRFLTAIGRIREYRWCFGIDDVRLALSYNGPVGIGIKWKSGMWVTDSNGYLWPTGDSVGGHEVELIGNDEEEKCAIGVNSWGLKWGIRGRFKIKHTALDELLADDGDAVQVTA